MVTKLDRFGRIVIPKQLRDNLGLGPGSILELVADGQRIVLRPVASEAHLRVKNGVLVFTGLAVGDPSWAVRSQRDERMRSVAERKSQ